MYKICTCIPNNQNGLLMVFILEITKYFQKYLSMYRIDYVGMNVKYIDNLYKYMYKLYVYTNVYIISNY